MKRLVYWLGFSVGVFFCVMTTVAQNYLGNSVVYATDGGVDPSLYYGNDYLTLLLGEQAERKMSILNTGERIQAPYHTRSIGLTAWDFNKDSLAPNAPFLIEPVYDEKGTVIYYHIVGTARQEKDNTPTAVALRFAPGNGIDLSGIAEHKDEFFLHMTLRVHESEDFVVLLSDGTQLWYVPIQNRGRQGAVPDLHGKYAFPADDNWYSVDVNLSDFRPANLSDYEQTPDFDLFDDLITDTVAIIALAAGQSDRWRIGGTNENLDIDLSDVFFYRKMQKLELKYTRYTENVWDKKKVFPLNYIMEGFFQPEGWPEGTWWDTPVSGLKLLISKLDWASTQPLKLSIDETQRTITLRPFCAGKTDVIIRTGFEGIEDTCEISVWGLLANLKSEQGNDLLFPLMDPADTINIKLDYLPDGGTASSWKNLSLPDGLELISFEGGWAKIKALYQGRYEIIGTIVCNGRDSTVRYPVYVAKATASTTTVALGTSYQLPAPETILDLSADLSGYFSEDYLKDAGNWEWTPKEDWNITLSRRGVLKSTAFGCLYGVKAALKGTLLSTLPVNFYVATVDSISPASNKTSPRKGKLGNNPPFSLHYTAYDNQVLPIVWSSDDDSIQVDPRYGTIKIIGATRGRKPVVVSLGGNETLRAEGFISFWPYADSVVIQTPLSVNMTLGNGNSDRVAAAEVWPDYAVNRDVRWESLHPDTVYVNPLTGAIRPLRKGKAQIRAVALASTPDGTEVVDTFDLNISFPNNFALYIGQSPELNKKIDTLFIPAGIEVPFLAFSDSFLLHPSDAKWAITHSGATTDNAVLQQTDEGCTVKAISTDTLTLSVTVEDSLAVGSCILIVSTNTQTISCRSLPLDVIYSEIFSPLGRLIARFSGSDNDVAMRSSLPEGVYLLRVTGRDGQRIVTKFKVSAPPKP
jgi:hypothetical protein